MRQKPLANLRVLDLTRLLPGPLATQHLADYGAEVIKIEDTGAGDYARTMGAMNGDTSFFYQVCNRGKKSVRLDLKQAEGRELFLRLVDAADVVVEGFRPGVMDKLGLGYDALSERNPKIVVCSISGYGQTGPYAPKPGYASVTEGISGFRYVNGFPGEPPVRPNLSIGDTIGGIHAALGIMIALWDREQHTGGTQGQVVDVALYESIFNLMEGVVPEFSGAGVIREASGTTITGIVPTNTYKCADGKFVVIGGNGDSIFQRLMKAAGHPEMANDPRMATNPGRVTHEQEIDAVLRAWCAAHDAAHILAELDKAQVPGGPIYNVQDMFADPHFNARGMFENVMVNGKPLAIPAILPKLGATPGGTAWPGPEVGSHSDEVLREVLQLSAADIAGLKQRGVVQG